MVAADDIFGFKKLAKNSPPAMATLKGNMINHQIFRYHFLSVKPTVMAMAPSYNWLFLWGYTFYKWGFVSTYNW